jgi:hypothetical protein
MSIPRPLLLPNALNWLPSRAFDVARTLGSFRRALPTHAPTSPGSSRLIQLPSSILPAVLGPSPSIQYDLQIPRISCISALGFFVKTARSRLGLSPVPPVALPRGEVGRAPGEGRRRQFSHHGSQQHPAARSGVPPSCKSASVPNLRTSDLRLRIWPGPRSPQPPTYPLPTPSSPLLPLATHHSANSTDRPA